MLVTDKGREILMEKWQLAESIFFKIIHGNTDSVMIATKCNSSQEFLATGSAVKQLVNERYINLEIKISEEVQSISYAISLSNTQLII